MKNTKMENQNLENTPENQTALTSAPSEIDKMIQLEELKKQNLETQLEIARLQNPNDSYKKDYATALKEFNELSPDEQFEQIELRKSNSSPANEWFDRTVWYLKPKIRNGKLVGTKPAVLIYAGQFVSVSDVEYIERLEKKYAKLNAIYRKRAEDEHFAKTGLKDVQVWRIKERPKSVQTVEKNTGVTIS